MQADELRGAESFTRDCVLVLVYLIIPAGFALGVFLVTLLHAFIASHVLVHLLPW